MPSADALCDSLVADLALASIKRSLVHHFMMRRVHAEPSNCWQNVVRSEYLDLDSNYGVKFLFLNGISETLEKCSGLQSVQENLKFWINHDKDRCRITSSMIDMSKLDSLDGDICSFCISNDRDFELGKGKIEAARTQLELILPKLVSLCGVEYVGLRTVGSCKNTFSIAGSNDLDLVLLVTSNGQLMSEDSTKNIFDAVSRCELIESGEFNVIDVVMHARVPVLKLKHVSTDVAVSLISIFMLLSHIYF